MTIDVHPLVPRELQMAAVAVQLVFLGWVLHLIRARRLNLRDSLLWLVSTTIALVVTLFPEALRWGAVRLGIEVPSNALFAVAILYLVLNLLALTIAVSNNAVSIRRLTQECALLRAELEAMRRHRER